MQWSDYPHQDQIDTRWKDNDVYGHVNNVEYLSYFDTVINRYLITQGGLDMHRGSVIGLCAESHCKYLAPLEFPHPVRAGLMVEHLGARSVRYRIALFGQDLERPAAEGWFVHVFVDRETRRATPPAAALRTALEALLLPSAA